MSTVLQVALGVAIGGTAGVYLGTAIFWRVTVLPPPYSWARRSCLWLARLSLRVWP